METPRTLIENTARLHGRNDLAGGLARDLVAAMAVLEAAVEIIREWHNMPHAGSPQGPGFDEAMETAWKIYYGNALVRDPLARVETIRREPVTAAFVAGLRAKPHGPHIDSLLDEIERLWGRERELLAANNLELDRRRKFEGEANQEYCEKILLRGECIRLRSALGILANHIEQVNGLADQALPAHVAAAMEAVFPPEAPAVLVESDESYEASAALLEARGKERL